MKRKSNSTHTERLTIRISKELLEAALTIRISKELLEAANLEAKRCGLSVSSFVRMLIAKETLNSR